MDGHDKSVDFPFCGVTFDDEVGVGVVVVIFRKSSPKSVSRVLVQIHG